MSPLTPDRLVLPDSSDRIVPPDELLACEAATIVAMQLTMLELLAKRAEALKPYAADAEFYVTNEHVLASSGFFPSMREGFRDSAVRAIAETRLRATEIDETAREMLAEIRPLAEALIGRHEAALRAKSRKPAH